MVITLEQYLVASLTAVICIFGFIFNGMALIILLRLRELQNAFGFMCTSHILSNIGVLLCFAFWGVPMTLTKSALASGSLGKAVSAIALLCWEVSIYSNLFMAFNRFTAIYLPFDYMAYFGKRTAIVFISLSWILGIAHVVPFFFRGCGLHYTTDSYLWLYDETPCSKWIEKWLDFYSSGLWVAVIGILDILNLIRIASIWKVKTFYRISGQRKRRETMFFAQAFCQNILFAIANFCFHTAVYWISDTIGVFLITTFLWGIIHAADGLILIIFNVGMHRKKVITNLFCKHETHQPAKIVTPKIKTSDGTNDSIPTTPMDANASVHYNLRNLLFESTFL